MGKTYNPKNKKRKKTHGFRKKSKAKSGKKILKRRRAKKRKRITC